MDAQAGIARLDRKVWCLFMISGMTAPIRSSLGLDTVLENVMAIFAQVRN